MSSSLAVIYFIWIKPVFKPVFSAYNKPCEGRVTSSYGNFGREDGKNGEFSWEKTDKVDIFKM